jgi:hypothetical protein
MGSGTQKAFSLLMTSNFSMQRSPLTTVLLQSDINHVRGWYISSCFKLNVNNTRVIPFSRKTNLVMVANYANPILHALTALKIWKYIFIDSTPNCISTVMGIEYFLRQLGFGG